MLALTAAMVSLAGGSASDNIAKSRLPISNSFVRNQGQWDPEVRFHSSAEGMDFWVTNRGYTLDLRQVNGDSDEIQGHVVKVSFVGSKGATVSEGTNPLPGKVNFLKGDESQRVTNVSRYAESRLLGLLPNVDARYYFENNVPRYDLIVKPGANPSSIRMQFEGAKNLRVDADGRLNYDTTLGTVQERGLTVYQQNGATKTQLKANYVVNSDNTVSFRVLNFDATRPIVIDPLVWYQNLNGAAADSISKVALDVNNNLIGVGTSLSSDYPTTVGAYKTTKGLLSDVVVSKYSADGTTLQWSTFLGGDAEDVGVNVVSTGAGGAVVVGRTTSANFSSSGKPLPRSLQNGTSQVLTNSDAFIAAVNSTGTGLSYGSRLGGSFNDGANGVVLGSATVAYVVGDTSSNSFPMGSGNIQKTYAGVQDGFLSRIDIAGGNVNWSSFLGGTNIDSAKEVVMQAGEPVVVGTTESTNLLSAFASAPGFAKTAPGGRDAFIVGTNAAGTAVRFRTYLGAAGNDDGSAVAVDASGNIGVTGTTSSSGFPLSNPYQNTYITQSAFVTVLNPTAESLTFSTFFGSTTAASTQATSGNDIGFDSLGFPIVVGTTAVSDLFTIGNDVDSSFGATLPADRDGFIVRFDVLGNLYYSSYVGGATDDAVTGVSVPTSGTTVGFGGSSFAGSSSGFIGKIFLDPALDEIVLGTVDATGKIAATVKLKGEVAVDSKVFLSSDNPNFTVPSFVTVTKGTSEANFSIDVLPLEATSSPIFTATYGATSTTATLTVAVPTITLNTFYSVTTVGGGTRVTGALRFSAATGNVPIKMSVVTPSGDPLGDDVGKYEPVMILTGTTKVGVALNTVPPVAPITVKGKAPGNVLTNDLTITPPVPSLTLNKTTVLGGSGTNVTGTIRLNGKAPVGGLLVTVVSDNPAALVPATVTVPAGLSAFNFAFRTASVAAEETANITISANGGSSTKSFQITPPQMDKIVFNTNVIRRGQTNLTRVYINTVAPAGGVTVTLEVTDPLTGVTIPTTVTIPAGAKLSDRFAIATDPLMDPATVVIKATVNGSSVSNSFSVTL